MENISVFVVFFIQANSFLCDTETVFGESDLNTVVGIQNLFCTGSKLCGSNQMENFTHYEWKLRVEIFGVFDGVCCKGCSCALDTCITSATCCPDMFDHVPTIQETAERITVTCEYAQFLPISIERSSGSATMMTRKCPKDFIVEDDNHVNIKDKCENPSNYESLETMIPVTDLVSKLTFQNIHCSKCHNVGQSKLSQWDLFVECKKFGDEAYLYSRDIGNIVQAVKASPSCNIIYKEPNHTMRTNLSSCEYVTKECNVTGLWETYDPLIEAACHAYISVFDYKYNNIFCALCNEQYVSDACMSEPVGGHNVHPSFSALLRFNGSPEPEPSDTNNFHKKCLENQIFDKWKYECRNLSCRFPKTVHQGKCVNGVSALKGASYKMYLKLCPDKLISTVDAAEVTDFLDDYMKELLGELGIADMVFSYNVYYLTNDTGHDSILTSTNNDTRTVFPFTTPIAPPPPPPAKDGRLGIPKTDEQLLISNVEYFLFYIKLYFASDFNDKTANILDEILRYEELTKFLHDKKSNFSASFKFNFEDFGDDSENPSPALRDVNENAYLQQLLVLYDYYVFNKGNIHLDFDISMLVSDVLAEKTRCPLIEIKSDHFSIDRRLNGIFFNELKWTVPFKYVYEDRTDEGVTYLICADLYLERVDQITERRKGLLDDLRARPQGILSLVCTCVSLLCNLVILLTYSLFVELRSQPGINNICLVVCLTIAQSLFQFGLMQAEHLGHLSCIVLGVSIHFFWLMVMFWMNVCSFHMFKVFIHLTETKTHNGKCQRTMVYLIYCISASAVFVVINVVVSSVTSNHSDIGYSAETCYISRPTMVGFVFALPVGIVVLINLLLFVIVIVKTNRIPTLKAENVPSRNYLSIYAKLSTITGITWIFGFMFFFTNESFLEYIFITLNASQGLFLCAAFVLNKRILSLYKHKLCM